MAESGLPKKLTVEVVSQEGLLLRSDVDEVIGQKRSDVGLGHVAGQSFVVGRSEPARAADPKTDGRQRDGRHGRQREHEAAAAAGLFRTGRLVDYVITWRQTERGEMARCAERYLLVSVPREPLWRGLNMARGAYLAQLGNTPGHLNHWSRRSFARLLSRFGQVVELRSPFPWTMLLVRL